MQTLVCHFLSSAAPSSQKRLDPLACVLGCSNSSKYTSLHGPGLYRSASNPMRKRAPSRWLRRRTQLRKSFEHLVRFSPSPDGQARPFASPRKRASSPSNLRPVKMSFCGMLLSANAASAAAATGGKHPSEISGNPHWAARGDHPRRTSSPTPPRRQTVSMNGSHEDLPRPTKRGNTV